MRCEYALQMFPKFTQLDAVLWYLAQAEEAEGDEHQAVEHYQRLARECDNGEYRQKAAARLRELGHSVPDQDVGRVEQTRQRLSASTPMLLNYSSYITGIPLKGVLIDESDEVDYDRLLLLTRRPDRADDNDH